MAKSVPNATVGIPVPADLKDYEKLAVYFGVKGFAPDYAQEDRLEYELSGLTTATVSGKEYWAFSADELPPQSADADYDLYFTLVDDVGKEGDFSPVISIPFDVAVPEQLGQPIVLS